MKQTQTGLLEHSKYFSYLLYGFSHAFPLLNSQHLCLMYVCNAVAMFLRNMLEMVYTL